MPARHELPDDVTRAHPAYDLRRIAARFEQLVVQLHYEEQNRRWPNAIELESKGEMELARTWRRIEDAMKLMREPLQS
ncbi:MAG: hypothetical protein KGQ48_00780 [Bradyrhizobium sp.]|nr:hypothetical protein [Bradyrhizobium sp.]